MGDEACSNANDAKNCGSPALENHSSMRRIVRFRGPLFVQLVRNASRFS